MKEVSNIGKLDAALGVLADRKDNQFYKSIAEVTHVVTDLSEADMVLNKLIKDGYADKRTLPDTGDPIKEITQRIYTITFEGKVFNELGGYKRQAEIIAKTESRKDFREKMLVYGTWAIAIGAVALVVWEIYKTFVLEQH